MRNSVYVQIMNNIKNEINLGIYTPGMFLPAEENLMKQYDVSKGTIRKAIEELIKEGILTKRKNVGTFVSYPVIQKGLTKLTGFTEDIIAKGGEPSSKLVSLDIVNPDKELQESLKLYANDTVYKIQRIRCDSNLPIAREIMYINTKLCPNLGQFDLEKESIYRLLEKEYHLSLKTAVQSVEPALAKTEDIQQLKVQSNDLLLYCVRVSYLDTGVPVECSKTWYRSDKYKFEVTLNR